MKDKFLFPLLALILLTPIFIALGIAVSNSDPNWEDGIYHYDTIHTHTNIKRVQGHPAFWVASIVEVPLLLGMFMFTLPKSACTPNQKCPKCSQFMKYKDLEKNEGLCNCGQKLRSMID